MGLHDEIFQGATPVLAGIDAASTCRHLLAAAERRDADTWGVPLPDAAQQGLDLDHTIADAGQGLRALPEALRRDARRCLHGLLGASPARWQGWNRLRAQVGGTFHALFAAVSRAMANTPRSNSLVESLNSRPRPCLIQRRHLGGSYLDLLRYFLNHRRFMRSRCNERRGKCLRELMTGQGHPHWLTLLGLGPLQPRRA